MSNLFSRHQKALKQTAPEMFDVQTECWQQEALLLFETINLTWRTLSTYQIFYFIFTLAGVWSNLETSKKVWTGKTLEMYDVYNMQERRAVVETSTLIRKAVSYQTTCWISSRLPMYKTECLCCPKITEEKTLFQILIFTSTSLTAINLFARHQKNLKRDTARNVQCSQMW